MATRLYSKNGVSDLVLIEDVNEDVIVETLRARHASDLIYTYIGPVLISVNPFREIRGLYTRKVIESYRGRMAYESPPHIFAIAEAAYRGVSRANNAIVVSGESGAGKTECAKLCMQYISAVSATAGHDVERVKDQLLKSNPMLEAFGNAKTVRNDNSSRFGKYQEIFFDVGGRPVGGHVTTYLLEKSRVVAAARDERSYHIFYQVCSGLPAAKLRELGLEGGAEGFRALSRTGCASVKGINDKADFAETCSGMAAMGITEAERDEVVRVIAAVLWLQEIDFVGKGADRSEVAPGPALGAAAGLLGCDEAALSAAVTTRTITTGGREALTKWLSAGQAASARDGLAKLLYSRLFDWVVARINAAMNPAGVDLRRDTTTIGVLDIFGFEIFESNSFEQLCINYVNERLQQVFIEKTLKSEQEEYQQEGIKWSPVPYFDNKPVCDLIAQPRRGLFAFLDEECVLGQGSDASFLEKSSRAFGGNKFFSVPKDVRGSRQDFVVQHYAGEVTYCSADFVDKNKDLVSRDHLALCEASRVGVVRDMFPAGEAAASGTKRPPTAGSQFVRQVGKLVETLNACEPHYIRCIKPNSRKQGGMFEQELSQHQVRYLGLLENVRVRRAGFAYRAEFGRFLARYKMLGERTWPHWEGPGGDEAGARELLRGTGMVEGTDFQMGRTKVFVRTPQSVFDLEERRERAIHGLVTLIQKTFRSWRARKFFLELREKSLGLFGQHKLRRRVSVRRYYVGDYLHAGESAACRAVLGKVGDSRVVFADVVSKLNRKFKMQDRALVLTERSVLNMVPGKFQLKRRIALTDIGSASVSTKADNYMVLHVPSLYDLVVVCDRKSEFLTALTDAYAQACGGRELRIDFSDSITYYEGKGVFGKKRDEAAPRRLAFCDAPAGRTDVTHSVDGLVVTVSVGDLDVVNAQYLQSVGPHKMRSGGAAAAAGKRTSVRAAALPPPPRPPRAPAGTFARAQYDFDGQSAQELSFKAGQRIKILKQEEDGWWSAEVNGTLGYVPASYVQLE